MLIKLLKFSFRAMLAVGRVVVVPLLGVAVRLSSWKNRPIDLGMALLNDEDVIKAATQAGAAGALVQLRQALTMMAQSVGNRMERRPALTQEDIDWAMFIQNYGENPQPDMVPAYLAYIKKSGTTGSTELPTWGALQSLCRRHRELKSQWVRDFVDVFDQMERKAEAAEPNRPGWNDYFMVQWFVTRDDNYARKIAERTKLPGMVGATCTWMAKSVAQQIPAFKEAMERVGYEFPEPDMRAAITHDAMARVPVDADGAIIVPQGGPFVACPECGASVRFPVFSGPPKESHPC